MPGATPAPANTKTGHGKRGTAAFDKTLERAFHQARAYITALPIEEGRPPFLIVCDVGHTIDLYAEFTGVGGQYERFPDPVSHRITLPDPRRLEIRARLRQVWLDPHSLDPSKVAAATLHDEAHQAENQADQLQADATAKLATGAAAEAKQLGAEAVRLRKESDKLHAEALQQVVTFHRHLCKLPFLGASRMREALGDGYVEALRKAWKGDVPESADFVMFWWQKAAGLVRDGKARQFGFITTHSIHQTFNRRVLESFLEGRDGSPSRPAHEMRMSAARKSPEDLSLGAPSAQHSHGPLGDRSLPLHLAYAIPDHPWIDSAGGAAVRIAMTVAAPGHFEGILEKVIAEQAREDGENEVVMVKTGGVIAANLQIGADVSSCKGLASNDNLSNRGFCLFGAGFIVSTEVAEILQQPSLAGASPIIWNYRNGKDLTNRPRGVKVIDAFPFSLNQLQSQHPGVYQHLLVHVKPERDHNSREGRKKLWWAFGEPNKKLRNQLAALPRYIATVEKADRTNHRHPRHPQGAWTDRLNCAIPRKQHHFSSPDWRRSAG